MQYTIRGIPPAVNRALRERARARRTSLNQAAVDVLREGVGVSPTALKRRDLGGVAGTWTADRAIDRALADLDRIDEDLWR
jgi:hypothetical protein